MMHMGRVFRRQGAITFRVAKIFWILLSLLVMLLGCHLAPIQGRPLPHETLQDGVYTGTYRSGPNRADVRVTIKAQRITAIELVKHYASWKGHRADRVIIDAIIDQQSTQVDAVSGATNSSRVIMNAVQAAVDAARIPAHAK